MTQNRSVTISPEAIPDKVYKAAIPVLCEAVLSFYSDAENRAAYDAWMRTPEGMAADMPDGGREEPGEGPEVCRVSADTYLKGGGP